MATITPHAPYFTLKSGFTWAMCDIDDRSHRLIVKWEGSERVSKCGMRATVNEWSGNYGRDRCDECITEYVKDEHQGKFPSGVVGSTANFKCPVCKESYYTKAGLDNHDCVPLAEVHPTAKNFITAARDFAYSAHYADTDKSGRPYWIHLKEVAEGARLLGGSDVAVAAGYLHDVVEDHPLRVNLKMLADIGFPKEVVQAVAAVSKQYNEEQGHFLDRIIKAGEDAMIVKLADLINHMRRDRHEELPKYTQVRHEQKYRPAIARLMMELGFIADQETQDNLKKIATVPVGTATGSGYGTYTGGQYNAKDGSSKYAGGSFIGSDWVAGWSAPIDHKVRKQGHKVTWALADGTVATVSESKQYRLWTQTAWQSRVTTKWDAEKGKKVLTKDSWSPANEPQDPKAAAKAKKGKEVVVKVTVDGKPVEDVALPLVGEPQGMYEEWL